MSEAVLSVPETAPARMSEDWLAVVIGLGVFALALLSLIGIDALGWVATTSVWTDPTAALAPVSKAYATLGGGASLVLTYLSLLAVLSVGAAALGEDVKRFALAFTAVFALAYACWFIGGWARLATVTPAEQAKFGLSWSLKLTSEGGFIVALLAGLAISNIFPGFAERLKSAIRPELYIKIAIVILGAFIAVTAAGNSASPRRSSCAASRRSLKPTSSTGLSFTSSRAKDSGSAGNGRRRSRRASRSAASRRPSRRAARSGRGLTSRCSSRPWW